MIKKINFLKKKGKEGSAMLFAKIQQKIFELRNDKKGADLVEWIGLIALVIGVVMLVSPQARSAISNLFTTVFNNLQNMSTGK